MATASKPYDSNDIESIERYALRLVGKTFADIPGALEYGHERSKGRLGNLLEELWFGYTANSEQAPDFKQAGVELKTTPYERNKRNELRAGERTVVTMIDYRRPFTDDFYKSAAWEKMRLLLFIFYWRDRQQKNELLYKIGFAGMFTPSENDVLIMRGDYDIIKAKMTAGLAHELSESDTLYLGACTKGSTAAKSMAAQYYNADVPAKKRAFCLKQQYMTFVLRHHFAKQREAAEPIFAPDARELHRRSFRCCVEARIARYIGCTDKQLCEQFNLPYTNNKAQWVTLAYRMLGVKNNRAEEFQKANIVVKAFRMDSNGRLPENMSFPPFKFADLAREEWEDSCVNNYFSTTIFLFVVFKRDGDRYKLHLAKLWNMPESDLQGTVKDEWTAIRDRIRNGVKFTLQSDKDGNVRVRNNLPGIKDTKMLHVRPHATKSAYKLSNGYESGNIARDANPLPDGQYMPTQSFWLNSSYILKQLGD